MAVQYSTRYGIAYNVARDHFQRCQAAVEACPSRKKEKFWELVQIADMAMDCLISTRAPDLAAFIEKTGIVNAHYADNGDSYFSDGVAEAMAAELAAIAA
jgi:hypothetical protein